MSEPAAAAARLAAEPDRQDPGAVECALCGLPVPTSRRVEAPAPSYCCLGCRIASALARPALPEGAADRTTSSHGTLLFRLGAGLFLSMNVMVFSGPFYARAWFGAAAAIPPDYGALERLFAFLLLFLTTLALVLLGGPLAADLLARPLRLDGGVLILLGVAAAYALSVANTLRGRGELYYDTAAMILVLVTVGYALEASARRRAAASAGALLATEPETAWVCRDDRRIEPIAVSALRPGDLVRVRPGEAIPVDGDVAEGESRVEEAILTGESAPRPIGPGGRVLAGAVNLEGMILVRAREVGADRAVRRMERMIDEARRRQAPLQRTADRVAAIFVPGVLILALAVFSRAAWRGDPAAGLFDGLSVLLIACPCAFGLAAPLATWVTLHRAAEKGILIDAGGTLERLARLRLVVFDKTGTLTTPVPSLLGVETAGARPGGDPRAGEDEALRLAAAVDSASLHPIARGLLAAARRRGLTIPPPREARALPGLGVEAEIAGRRLALGGPRLAERRGIAVDPGPDEMTVVHLFDERSLLASFRFAESVRPDAAAAIAAIQELGLEVEILTGDRPGPAARLGRALGVPATSSLLPEEKVARLVAARRAGEGPVAMVGDGINDAPVLAAADVGFAVASASDLARRAGPVRLVHDRLDRVPEAIALGRDAMRRIRLNLAWAFGYNAIGLALAAQGRLTPIFAASTMLVSSLVIIGVSHGAGRSLRARRGSEEGVRSPWR